MCHFITACLPDTVSVRQLRAVLKAHRQTLRPLDNPWVEEQLPAGSQYLTCTVKYCDCGTCLGWSARQEEAGPEADETSRLRRKGWSEARIGRWREERRLARERAEQARGEAAPREQADAWAAYVRDLLDQPGAAWFGLLLHWYRDSPETERVRLRDAVAVPRHRLTPETLLGMQEDVLYLFRSGGPAP
jgi:hypothetical protein